MKGDSDEVTYCDVVKIDTVRADLFLGQINDLQVTASDVVNVYLHRFSKEKIYRVAGPEFGEW